MAFQKWSNCCLSVYNFVLQVGRYIWNCDQVCFIAYMFMFLTTYVVAQLKILATTFQVGSYVYGLQNRVF